MCLLIFFLLNLENKNSNYYHTQRDREGTTTQASMLNYCADKVALAEAVTSLRVRQPRDPIRERKPRERYF